MFVDNVINHSADYTCNLLASQPPQWVVGQFHGNSSGSASWIDHTLNITFKLTHYRRTPERSVQGPGPDPALWARRPPEGGPRPSASMRRLTDAACRRMLYTLGSSGDTLSMPRPSQL
jgi:hypothetical protein